ncbi:HEPN domain-containing protein [Candidatus Micrarchaeota archaeon]|nr:HEPN domain-containing protein [Candidatus Micrarchaeota archaeon]
MIEELIREGQLVKTAPDTRKAENSIVLAKSKIETARAELAAGIYDNSLVSAYTAMFHAARAILFKDGFKERGHYAVYSYIKERYGTAIEMKYLNELNVLRTIRHKVIYGDEDANAKEVRQAEAEDAIAMASGFVGAVRKILGD